MGYVTGGLNYKPILCLFSNFFNHTSNWKDEINIKRNTVLQQCGDRIVLLKIDNFAWCGENLEEILKIVIK